MWRDCRASPDNSTDLSPKRPGIFFSICFTFPGVWTPRDTTESIKPPRCQVSCLALKTHTDSVFAAGKQNDAYVYSETEHRCSIAAITNAAQCRAYYVKSQLHLQPHERSGNRPIHLGFYREHETANGDSNSLNVLRWNDSPKKKNSKKRKKQYY